MPKWEDWRRGVTCCDAASGAGNLGATGRNQNIANQNRRSFLDEWELSTEVNEGFDAGTSRPIRSMRLLAIAFALSCYASFAALYFFKPNKPVLSLGQMRFTIDALLEWVFTILTLPGLGLAYFYGIRNHEENQNFAVPDIAIDFLFVAAIAWVAIGNGIHLTSKLDEQMISSLNDERWLGIKANFHWIRQVVGHVLPHMGWQVLFSALMLGQLRDPIEVTRPKQRFRFLGLFLVYYLLTEQLRALARTSGLS